MPNPTLCNSPPDTRESGAHHRQSKSPLIISCCSNIFATRARFAPILRQTDTMNPARKIHITTEVSTRRNPSQPVLSPRVKKARVVPSPPRNFLPKDAGLLFILDRHHYQGFFQANRLPIVKGLVLNLTDGNQQPVCHSQQPGFPNPELLSTTEKKKIYTPVTAHFRLHFLPSLA